MVSILLKEYRVNPNEPPASDRGLTALQCAAAMGHLLVARDPINAGALVNAGRAEREGHTALEVAARLGRLDIVKPLIDAGAGISYSEFGQEQFDRAAQHASSEEFPVLAKYLKKLRKELHREPNEATTDIDDMPSGLTSMAWAVDLN